MEASLQVPRGPDRCLFGDDKSQGRAWTADLPQLHAFMISSVLYDKAWKLCSLGHEIVKDFEAARASFSLPAFCRRYSVGPSAVGLPQFFPLCKSKCFDPATGIRTCPKAPQHSCMRRVINCSKDTTVRARHALRFPVHSHTTPTCHLVSRDKCRA